MQKIDNGLDVSVQKELFFKYRRMIKSFKHKGLAELFERGRNTTQWTRSIAVGSKGFVEKVKSLLGVLAEARKSVKTGKAYQLREPPIPYGAHFGVKKEDIGPENTYFQDINI